MRWRLDRSPPLLGAIFKTGPIAGASIAAPLFGRPFFKIGLEIRSECSRSPAGRASGPTGRRGPKRYPVQPPAGALSGSNRGVPIAIWAPNSRAARCILRKSRGARTELKRSSDGAQTKLEFNANWAQTELKLNSV